MTDPTHRDWDTIYRYFYERGFASFIFSSLPNLGVAFLVAIAPIFLFGCIDYSAIPNANRISDVILPFSIGWARSNLFLKLSTIVFLFWTSLNLIILSMDLFKFQSIRPYYVTTLGIHDSELITVKWSQVVESISVNDISLESPRLELAQQILRTDNYVCSLVCAPSILIWTPSWSNQATRIPMSHFFFFYLTIALKGLVIAQNGSSIVNDPSTNLASVESGLRIRFRVIGLLLLVFSPAILAFEIEYFVYDFIQTVRKSGLKFSLRAWSPAAKWLFREYNELPHKFHARIAQSYRWANLYLDSGRSLFVRPLALLISFASGSLLVGFIILCILTDASLVFSSPVVFGKSGGWCAMVLVIAYVVSHYLSQSNESQTREAAMANLERLLRYDFRDESHSANSEHTVARVKSLFPSLLMQIWLELASVLLNPFFFAVFLPEKAHSIVDFVKRNSADRGVIGWISAYSTFDVGERGFAGSADQREKVLRSVRDFECDSEIREMEDSGQSLLPGLDDSAGPDLLIPKPSLPLLRTDFGGSNEALSELDGAFSGGFLPSTNVFDQDF
jgi:autophagy-related protein 9